MTDQDSGLVTQIMDEGQIRRALKRIAHEILERNTSIDDLVLAGIHTRGVPLAERLADFIEETEEKRPRVGTLDVTFHRDDYHLRAKSPEKYTNLPPVDNLNVVLVDDVVYAGRTARAAIDAVLDFGRARTIQLAALIDRNGRELPIRADYVGKEFLQTLPDDMIRVRLSEIDGVDEVLFISHQETR